MFPEKEGVYDLFSYRACMSFVLAQLYRKKQHNTNASFVENL